MKERITFLMAVLCLMGITATSQSNVIALNVQNQISTNFLPVTLDSYLAGVSTWQEMDYSFGVIKNKKTVANELHSITSVFPDPVADGQQLFIPSDHLEGATRMEMITIYGELVQTLNPEESAVTMPDDLEYGTYFISVYRNDVINNLMITVD